jgi:hypothetical protein
MIGSTGRPSQGTHCGLHPGTMARFAEFAAVRGSAGIQPETHRAAKPASGLTRAKLWSLSGLVLSSRLERTLAGAITNPP